MNCYSSFNIIILFLLLKAYAVLRSDAIPFFDLKQLKYIKIISFQNNKSVCFEIINKVTRTFAFMTCANKLEQVFILQHEESNILFKVKSRADKKSISMDNEPESLLILHTDKEGLFLISPVNSKRCLTYAPNTASLASYYNLNCSFATFNSLQKFLIVSSNYMESLFLIKILFTNSLQIQILNLKQIISSVRLIGESADANDNSNEADIADDIVQVYLPKGTFMLIVTFISCDYYTNGTQTITVTASETISISLLNTSKYDYFPLATESSTNNANSCAPSNDLFKNGHRLGVYSLKFVKEGSGKIIWGDINFSTQRIYLYNIEFGSYKVYQACYGYLETITTNCISGSKVTKNIIYYKGNDEIDNVPMSTNYSKISRTFSENYEEWIIFSITDLSKMGHFRCSGDEALKTFKHNINFQPTHYLDGWFRSTYSLSWECTKNSWAIDTDQCYLDDSPLTGTIACTEDVWDDRRLYRDREQCCAPCLNNVAAVCDSGYALNRYKWYRQYKSALDGNHDYYYLRNSFNCCKVKLAMVYYKSLKIYADSCLQDVPKLTFSTNSNEVVLGYIVNNMI